MKLLGKTTNADRAKKHLFAAQATYYEEPLTKPPLIFNDADTVEFLRALSDTLSAL